MPPRPTRTLHPALHDLVRALARMAVAQEARESEEAAADIVALRAELGLEDDFPAWKRRIEGLMAAFYRHVPQWGEVRLKGRVRLVTLALRELGPNASHRRAALRAGELLEAELAASAAAAREQARAKRAAARVRRASAAPAPR